MLHLNILNHMEEKSWSWNEMYFTIYISNWYLFIFMILSPGSWQTWYQSREICIDVHTLYFFYLADDEAPILNCPNISSPTDEGLNSSSTVLLNSTATDNVDYHLDVICSHSSEGIFLIGDTTVNCSSADAAGNTDTCLLVVTVTGVNMIILLCLKDSDHRSGLRFIGYVIYTLKDESLGICMCSTINNL